MNTEREIEIRSEDIKDIISYIPNWMIRWGNFLILCLVFSFVLGLFLIQYPDVINSEITITAPVPPIKIVSKHSGRLIELPVEEGKLVKRDEVLAVIENPSNYKDILKLKSLINNFNPDSAPISGTGWIEEAKLGEIENDFSTFQKSLKEYLLQLELNPEQRESALIQQQIVEYKKLYAAQLHQQKIFEEELGIVSKDFERSQNLYNQKVLSVLEFEEKRKEYLQGKRNYENLKISLSNTIITGNDLNKSLTLLDIKDNKIHNSLKRDLDERLRNLKVSILSWEQKYLLASPVDGKVSFLSNWSHNQFVKEGESIFSIIPAGRNKIIGRLLLPVRNSGKVKPGQDVNICLDSYPCEEWGILKGKVKTISLVPQNGKYHIEVEIPEGMKTSYNRNLVFKQEMQGTARVITEKIKLIERIFYKLKSISNN